MGCTSENGRPEIGASPGCIGFRTDAPTAAQIVAQATWAKVLFISESYDLGGFFNPALARWTPPSGLVIISGMIYTATNLTNGFYAKVSLYKNGAQYLDGAQNRHGATGLYGEGGTFQDLANGTDFYELWWFHNDPAAQQLSVNPIETWFSGMCGGVRCSAVEVVDL